MEPAAVQDIIGRGLELTVLIISVLIVPALVIGLLVSLLQAATGVQEMTLSFVPKLVVVLLTLVVAGPWLIGVMVDYTRGLVEGIPYLIGVG